MTKDLISPALRASLRYEGYAKVSAQVMADAGEYPTDVSSLQGAIQSLSVKVAVNRVNERNITEGLDSLKAFRRLP